MLTVTVYHNTDARCTPYQDGHQLIAGTSLRVPAGAEPDPDAVADWAFHTFNADLDQLENSRGSAHDEITLLAACVYRLLGHRSLSIGDVIHVLGQDHDQWLACEPFGWRQISAPRPLPGVPLTAATVLDRLRSQRPDTPSAPGLFTTSQVSEALNQAADDILEAVNGGDEGLRDALNLMVNATSAYLDGAADDLREVVERNYDEDYTTVLGWIATVA